jgi:hypothetical protein
MLLDNGQESRTIKQDCGYGLAALAPNRRAVKQGLAGFLEVGKRSNVIQGTMSRFGNCRLRHNI